MALKETSNIYLLYIDWEYSIEPLHSCLRNSDFQRPILTKYDLLMVIHVVLYNIVMYSFFIKASVVYGKTTL